MTTTTLSSIEPPEKIHGMALFPLREVFVKARGGKMWMRKTKIGITWEYAFRKSWKDKKQEWVDRGFSLRSEDGAWYVQQWLIKTPEGFALPEPAPTIRKPAGALIEQVAVELPELPPLPGEFEDKLLPYQRQPARQLYRAITCGLKEWGYPGALDLSDLGCHAKGQLILMADGELMKVEDVRVGDAVMGWKGPQTVTELKRGRSQMARINPVKGQPFIVNTDHILTLQYSPASLNCGLGKHSGKIIDITVSDFLKLPKNHQNQLKLFRECVNWPDRQHIISPYVMGALLGDGCFRSHSPSITALDLEIINECQAEASRLGARLVEHLSKDRCPTYFFRSAQTMMGYLRRVGLWNQKSEGKFIPHEYKATDFNQRLDLLAGIIDTDGHLSAGGFEIVAKSSIFASDIVFVARSLGFAAHKAVKLVKYQGEMREYHRVFISGDCHLIPCRVERKKCSARLQKKSVLRTGFSVELLEEDDFYGFSLDGDGRFLLGDFTVTHNTGKTYQCLAAALATGRRVNVICTVSTIPSWKRAFRHFGAEPGMICNWEGLRTGGTFHAPAITELSSSKRSGPVANAYKWRLNADKDILLCDEAHNARTVGSLNQALAMSAIRTGVPIIAMSATMLVDPTHMRFCGRIIGLHRNKEGYFRFLEANGCTRVGGEYEWRFCGGSRGRAILANISRKVIPMRGARVKKEDLGDAFPETQIWAEPIACEDTDKIGAHWRKVQEMTEKLIAKGMSEQAAERILEKEYREGWQMSEMAKVPALAELIREKIAEGFSVPVFMSFTASREKLLAAIGSTCTIHGGQQGVGGRKERQSAIDAFQEDKEHAIIVQIAAGGTGVDMHDVRGERPRYAIHLPNPRPDHVIQALGRVQRAGGKSTSFQVVLYAEGTMEEQIVENIRRKAMQINAFNNGDSKAKAHF
jgi:hypothetical protein